MFKRVDKKEREATGTLFCQWKGINKLQQHANKSCKQTEGKRHKKYIHHTVPFI